MRELLKEIENSFRYLSYEKSWDDEGAEPMNLKAYCRAMELLFRMNNEIGEIQTPHIGLCSDGSIDIEFSKWGSVILLINITDKYISWFGDDLDGNIVNDKRIGDAVIGYELSKWIKAKLLK